MDELTTRREANHLRAVRRAMGEEQWRVFEETELAMSHFCRQMEDSRKWVELLEAHSGEKAPQSNVQELGSWLMKQSVAYMRDADEIRHAVECERLRQRHQQ